MGVGGLPPVITRWKEFVAGPSGGALSEIGQMTAAAEAEAIVEFSDRNGV